MKYFTAFIKPASSLCNLHCKYCFYRDVSENRDNPSFGIMSAQTAFLTIDRVYGYCLAEPTKINFSFQGGEPTLAGLDFFKEFTAYARKNKPERCEISFSIQTNAVLIDRAWCEFLKENSFLVGISFDGSSSLHDANRTDERGFGTANSVLRAIRLMREYRIEFNILCTVSCAVAKHPAEVMKTAEKMGFDNLQFIPCLDPLDGPGGAYSLKPKDYAQFLKTVCDIWAQRAKRGEYISIRLFENLIMLMRGEPAEQCGACGFCTAQFVVEADGSVYPCDFYVLDRYRMGNLQSESVKSLTESENLVKFMNYEESKNDKCSRCGVYALCGGGCKRYRKFLNSVQDYCPMQDFLYSKGAVIEQISQLLG